MRSYVIAAILLIFLVIPGTARAGLAGDMIGMMHEYNSSGSVEYKTVVLGPSDAYEYEAAYTANPEDTSILVDFFNPDPTYETVYSWTGGSFNGLVITDISAPLIGVLVNTNFNKIAVVGPNNNIYYVDKTWDPSTMMTFNASSVRFDWRDFVFYYPDEDPYYFNASLTFEQQPVVPEPASFLLFGIGGIAAALVIRRRRA